MTTGDRYFAPARELPPRPLGSEADLDRAVAMRNRLLDVGKSCRGEDEDDYRHVLGSLVSDYEGVRWPMPSDFEEREVIRVHREARLIEPDDDPS